MDRIGKFSNVFVSRKTMKMSVPYYIISIYFCVQVMNDSYSYAMEECVKLLKFVYPIHRITFVSHVRRVRVWETHMTATCFSNTTRVRVKNSSFSLGGLISAFSQGMRTTVLLWPSKSTRNIVFREHAEIIHQWCWFFRFCPIFSKESVVLVTGTAHNVSRTSMCGIRPTLLVNWWMVTSGLWFCAE